MKKIILIGPPGCGKSTVGQALSVHLQRTFIDTDAVIEVKMQKKIADIFIEDGEAAFRVFEFEILQEVLTTDHTVIALGGGAPISAPAQAAIENSGSHVIFLDVSLAIAAPRVGFNRDRPLLLGNPRAQWLALSESRRPIYEKLATCSIKVDGMNVAEILNLIQEEVR